MGAEAGAPVCLIAEKSVQAFAVYLACLRGGYAFFPINAGYTDAEIDYLIGDAAPKVVIADPERTKGLKGLATSRGAAFVTLAGDGTGSLMQAADAIASAPDPYPATNRPWTWKIGRTCSSTSSSEKRQASRRAMALALRLAWVSTAPLGLPVVPEV